MTCLGHTAREPQSQDSDPHPPGSEVPVLSGTQRELGLPTVSLPENKGSCQAKVYFFHFLILKQERKNVG